MKGHIFDIKEMAIHDGPGIRSTVFFKGCPLRCRWCHNPEGLTPEPQLMYKASRCKSCELCLVPCNHEECAPFGRCIHACPDNLLSITGKAVTPGEVAERLKKSAEPLGDMFGGFTFSGGEPLMQPEFLSALIDSLKGYHLCIETSGYSDSELFRNIIEKLDFVIMDIKLADGDRHKAQTGVGNEKILNNFKILKKSGKPHIIRTPLIPGITDTDENLMKISEIIDGSTWEKLPYNSVAGAKYKLLGMKFPLDSNK